MRERRSISAIGHEGDGVAAEGATAAGGALQDSGSPIEA